ncbi:cytochrome b-c1 complex subunit 6, mitochondrial-like isoform X1 [Mytilus galloprovincialis]|uniref:Cytochrome b-c1 complex subunit 6 n=1 Tax=Mytilus galloprovincialis TaxID=29158 RepID=A0A8B6F2U6_MYTGA|nr:ubiquinol-cytochrome c reductase subunit 6 [Mytilus galloprovincialis]
MTLGENTVALKDPEVEDDAPADDDEDDEPEDIQVTIKESCQQNAECVKYKDALDSCNARVSSRKETEETCYEEVLDYVHCVDHCVAKNLFNKLK